MEILYQYSIVIPAALLTPLLITNAFFVFIFMSCAFIISLIRKRNDVADVAWGLGFMLIAWTSYIIWSPHSTINLLLPILVTLWGLRLAGHIHMRNKGKKEDYRYAQWRKDWGRWFFIRSYLQVFILQGFLMLIITLPVMAGTPLMHLANPWFIGTGLGVWVIGFLFESIGDLQLVQFMGNPKNKGKLMQDGLWKFTRHPNYFGEVTQWWGIWIMTIGVPPYWVTIISPLMITFLIFRVSGIPMLEKKMSQHKDWKQYASKTSAFFPLLPKS